MKRPLLIGMLAATLSACGGSEDTNGVVNSGSNISGIYLTGTWVQKTTYNECRQLSQNNMLNFKSNSVAGFIDTLEVYAGSSINLADCSYDSFDGYSKSFAKIITPTTKSLFKAWLSSQYLFTDDEKVTISISEYTANSIKFSAQYLLNDKSIIEETQLTR